jgi:ABC-2 type transport system ATP-binding protein
VKTVIEIKNLTKKFGDFIALNDISFNVQAGEVFGYIGPNGAGKTTTIRAILGLINPTTGNITVLGDDVSKYEKFRWHIGAVLENTGLYNKLSGFENLNFYAQIYKTPIEKRKKTIDELLHFVGLYDRAQNNVGTYSKGMRQRLAIARALLHDPQILIMDEPTSGLDPDAQLLIRELISGLVSKRNMTIFLSSHNLIEIEKMCSKIAVIREGRIIESGPITDLKKKFAQPHIEILLSNEIDVNAMQQALSKIADISIISIEKNRIVAQCEADSTDFVREVMLQGAKIQEIRKGFTSLEEIYQSIVHQRKAQ